MSSLEEFLSLQAKKFDEFIQEFVNKTEEQFRYLDDFVKNAAEDILRPNASQWLPKTPKSVVKPKVRPRKARGTQSPTLFPSTASSSVQSEISFLSQDGLAKSSRHKTGQLSQSQNEIPTIANTVNTAVKIKFSPENNPEEILATSTAKKRTKTAKAAISPPILARKTRSNRLASAKTTDNDSNIMPPPARELPQRSSKRLLPITDENLLPQSAIKHAGAKPKTSNPKKRGRPKKRKSDHSTLLINLDSFTTEEETMWDSGTDAVDKATLATVQNEVIVVECNSFKSVEAAASTETNVRRDSFKVALNAINTSNPVTSGNIIAKSPLNSSKVLSDKQLNTKKRKSSMQLVSNNSEMINAPYEMDKENENVSLILSDDDSVIIIDGTPLAKHTLSYLKPVVKIEPLPTPCTNNTNVSSATGISNSSAKQYSTPLRLDSLHNAKRSLHSNLIRSAKTPESPKQLFSPYIKGNIKGRANAFEMMAKNNSILEDELSVAKCGQEKNLRRSSFRRPSQTFSNHLMFAKAARMSTSARRSSIMRHRLSVSTQQCIRKVSASLRRSSKVAAEVDDIMEIEDVSGAHHTADEPMEIPGNLQVVHELKEAQIILDRLPLESSSRQTYALPAEIAIENLQKSAGNLTTSSVASRSSASAENGHNNSSSATTATAEETTTKAAKNFFSSLKKYSSGQLHGQSDTRIFHKSRVAAMVSLYSKGPSTPSNSCSKVPTWPRMGSSQTSLSSSMMKNFQKPSYALSSSKAKAYLIREEIEKRKAKEEVALRKKQELLKQRTEESKRKNGEKQQRVRENRMKEQEAVENLRRTLEKQDLVKKGMEEKKRSVLEAKKQMRQKKEAEIEMRRKQEEAAAMEKLKERQLLKEAAAEKLKKKKQAEESARLAAVLREPTFVKPTLATSNLNSTFTAPKANLNETYTAEKSVVDGDNYDMTPHRSELPKEELKDPNNYDIEDLNSGDETDKDDDPKKKIPDWAQGISLRIAVINNYRNPIDPVKLFAAIKTCDLDELFKIKRSRFKQRTSSAVWHTAMVPNL